MIFLFLLQAASAVAPAPVPAAAPVLAPWAIRSRTEATGTTSMSVSASSRDGNARLVVRCDHSGDNIVSIQFIPKPSFEKATPRPVSIQADGGATLGTNWEFPGGGAYTREDAVVTTLSTTIAGAREIKVRAIDPANQPVEAMFDGPRSDSTIREVLKSCGYVFGEIPVRAPAPAAPAEKPADDAE